MSRTICLINGHPDPSPGHFVAALCEAYANSARQAGHTVHRIDIGAIDVPLLRNMTEFVTPPPPAIQEAQAALTGSDHLVLVYPLWLGTMPARLKAFLEQLARNDFVVSSSGEDSGWPVRHMTGKSARVIVTMGMPALAYRTVFGKHSVKALENGILRLAGFKPVRDTILGMVESSPALRSKMLAKVARLGGEGR